MGFTAGEDNHSQHALSTTCVTSSLLLLMGEIGKQGSTLSLEVEHKNVFSVSFREQNCVHDVWYLTSNTSPLLGDDEQQVCLRLPKDQYEWVWACKLSVVWLLSRIRAEETAAVMCTETRILIYFNWVFSNYFSANHLCNTIRELHENSSE